MRKFEPLTWRGLEFVPTENGWRCSAPNALWEVWPDLAGASYSANWAGRLDIQGTGGSPAAALESLLVTMLETRASITDAIANEVGLLLPTEKGPGVNDLLRRGRR
jgi:hypothetical protein